MEEVASYLAALPAPAVDTPLAGDLRNGNNFYHAKCGACHGGKAEGNSSLNAPRLTSLSADYIKRQYRNFQQGLRGSHPDDRYGRQMKMMASSLPTGKDLDDVVAFIQAQAEKPVMLRAPFIIFLLLAGAIAQAGNDTICIAQPLPPRL